MSAEAAFLETLTKTPADDTARLVYADWLDEQGRAQEAEYLRLVVVLTRICEDCTREQPEVARLLALALPLEWRQAAGSRFMLIFYSFGNPANKLNAIKCIREITGQGLAEAKATSEQPPKVLLACVPFEQALTAYDHSCSYPSLIVHIHPVELTALPFAVLYTITASRSRPMRHQNTQIEDAVAGFAAFLQVAMSITPDAATRLARDQHTVTIAEDLEMTTALTRVAELKALILARQEAPRWGIMVRSIAVVSPADARK